MFIVDYLRTLDGPEGDQRQVTIASYHRGHLGLMPGTPVSIALMGYGHSQDHGYEVSVTPFKPKRTLFYLTVVLEDQPGVVNALLQAISSLRLNIIVQQSACINHQNHHVVDLLLDWSSSKFVEPTPMPEGARYRAAHLSEIIPQDDFRYVVLLARLICYCGDFLTWKRTGRGRREIPNIRVRPAFERGNVIDDTGGTVSRLPDQQRLADQQEKAPLRLRPRIGIELPEDIVATVRRSVGYPDGEPLPYIVLSEGPGRNLRIFFPTKSKASRIIHCSFIHEDSAGALAAIAQLLCKERDGGRFNIITSLLRRFDATRQSWEVHLEFIPNCYKKARVSDEPPSSGDTPPIPSGKTPRKEMLKWVQEKLAPTEAEGSELAFYGVVLAVPRYPAEQYEDITVRLYTDRDRELKRRQPMKDVDEAMRLAYRGMFKDKMLEVRNRRKWIYSYLAPLVVMKPVVFLSFPVHAGSHAQAVREALGKHFVVVDGMEPSGRDIASDVAERICEADYFLGIWRPEPDEKSRISPWLLFEFGIARSHGKQVVLAVDEAVDEKIWKRIDSNRSVFRFSDLSFMSKTVGEIKESVRQNWVHHALGYSLSEKEKADRPSLVDPEELGIKEQEGLRI